MKHICFAPGRTEGLGRGVILWRLNIQIETVALLMLGTTC